MATLEFQVGKAMSSDRREWSFLQAVRARAQPQQAASASPPRAATEAPHRPKRKAEVGSNLPVKVKPLIKVAKRVPAAVEKIDTRHKEALEDEPPDESSTAVLGSLFGEYASDSGDEH